MVSILGTALPLTQFVQGTDYTVVITSTDTIEITSAAGLGLCSVTVIG